MPRQRVTLGVLTPSQRRRQEKRRREAEENDDPQEDAENQQPPPQPQPQIMPVLPKAFTYAPHTFRNECHIGAMTNVCQHCQALKFVKETKGMCCSNGKIILDALPNHPPELESLYHGQSEQSIHFLENIRKYNSAFQLTSFGCTEVRSAGWNPSFRIQGQVCHLVGPLEPTNENSEQFLQVYFMDTDDQARRRNNIIEGLRPEVILCLQDVLHTHNKYVQQLKSAYEFAKGQFPSYKIVINETARPAGEHERRYNAPTTHDVAILMPNDPVGHRDIVLHTRSNQLQRINELHKAYDTLQYPLIMSHGTDGWSLQLKLTSRHKITQLQYYCFHFFTRPGNHILLARRVFQQFMVDAYAKIECERLQFLRREQKQLRADNYKELRDAVINNDGNAQNVGQKVILPATYCGGPRYMFERQQDAMAYVRKYGRPSLFVTVTTNPNWPEITDSLSPGQHSHDRPDLVVRVFRLKLQKLLGLLKDGCFGSVEAWLYSIEFQKRGLPHAHILLWLTRDSAIHPNSIDNVVVAELPDKDTDPDLSDIVLKNMIHGPCGHANPSAPCMKEGKCSKNFPRAFVQNTETGMDSYPNYRRRSPGDGGKTAVKDFKNTEIQIDNRWVVPYNPWLLRQLQCHVNVEICASIKSIKYVLKYVHKGADQATFQLQENVNKDEISNYINARYIGSTEAAWRIFEMPLHERYPTVVQLAVHLENGQRVYFTTNTAVQVAAAEAPKTTLTSFLSLCSTDNFAKNLIYGDVPRYYTWNQSAKQWNRRKRGNATDTPGIFATPTIGRIYTVSPKQGECFCLRLLLLSVKGPTSFAHLRTFEGHVYETYREACLARGLLENDNMQRLALQEAAVSSFPQQLRNMFALLLTQTSPSNPMALWLEFKEHFTEDYLHNQTLTAEQSANMALICIEDMVMDMGGQLHEFGLPKTDRENAERTGNEYRRETHYDTQQERHKAQQNVEQLTPEQTAVFTQFNERIERGHAGLCFLDAPGGCGKTFLIETILASQRAQSKIAIATASSGLAATLLPGGRTVHSTFKIPLNVMNTDVPMCSIKKGTALARLVQDAVVLIVDEAPMLHRKVLEAMDRTFRDIRSTDDVMGGLPTLLCGDFRQILPVVRGGTRANVVDACLKKSLLWQYVTLYELKTNMRAVLSGNKDSATFSDMLLRIGTGAVPYVSQPDTISLTEFGNQVKTEEDLIGKVFPGIVDNFQHETSLWLTERAILAPLNDTVTNINRNLINTLPGMLYSYAAINTVVDETETVQYPTEFLNSIEVSGLPPHLLSIKIGIPVMLLRSLLPPKLMNGTRCIVINCKRNVVEVEIATGAYAGERHFIPRINLQPSDTTLPFLFQRKQFPLQPCFAMTINKAQGQSLQTVGLHLTQPIFSHGMLYVALSRAGNWSSIFHLSPNGNSRNVVYNEVL